MAFKDRLAYIRNKHGISQVIAAYDLNIGIGTIGMYETGDRRPVPSIMYRMALYFRVDPAWLSYGALLSAEQAEEFRKRFFKAIEGMDADERFAHRISCCEVEAFEDNNMPLREDVVEDIAFDLDFSVDDILKKGEL